ncbi:GNAT family N-acetyltransferase [Candidatus Uhrbacteria bacterium]|nr:GNAT family N-acetyltransferase [Candidatus Uhrbacteria bacterium]
MNATYTTTTARSVLTSERLVLRPVTIADATEQYVRWLNDTTVHRYSEYRFVTHTIESARAYVERVCADEHVHFFAIVTREGKRHIGNMKLGPIHPHHERASFGIMIGERDAWGRGYATEALALLEQYAFTALGLHKLTAGAVAENAGSIRLLEKRGFTREGVQREHFRDGDRFLDVVAFGKLRSDA